MTAERIQYTLATMRFWWLSFLAYLSSHSALLLFGSVSALPLFGRKSDHKAKQFNTSRAATLIASDRTFGTSAAVRDRNQRLERPSVSLFFLYI